MNKAVGLFALFLLLFVLAAPVAALDCGFRTSDKWLLGGFYVFLVADYTSTKKALAMGHTEWNPLVGEQPSNEHLLAWHLASGAAVTAASCWIDPGWKRTLLLSLAMSVEAYATHNNYTLIARTKW